MYKHTLQAKHLTLRLQHSLKYNALNNYFNALIVLLIMQCDIMRNCNQLWSIFLDL